MSWAAAHYSDPLPAVRGSLFGPSPARGSLPLPNPPPTLNQLRGAICNHPHLTIHHWGPRSSARSENHGKARWENKKKSLKIKIPGLHYLKTFRGLRAVRFSPSSKLTKNASAEEIKSGSSILIVLLLATPVANVSSSMALAVAAPNAKRSR